MGKQLTHRNKPAEMYGIHRMVHSSGADLWRVEIRRRGRVVMRTFHDGAYGGEAEALKEAAAYRDAVQNLFPPLTNREWSQGVRRTDQPGVYRVERPGGYSPAYRAEICELDGKRYTYYNIDDHGEHRAKVLAIAERQKFFDEMKVRVWLPHPVGKRSATEAFEDFMAEPDLMGDRIGKLIADAETRLKEINAAFDARRPSCINLRLAVSGGGDTLRLKIGNNANTLHVNKRTVNIRFNKHSRTLEDALALARHRAGEIIEMLYDAKIRTNFVRKYAKAFKEENFDVGNGLTIHERMARQPGHAQRKPQSKRQADGKATGSLPCPGQAEHDTRL